MATSSQVRMVVIALLFSSLMFLAIGLYFLLIAENVLIGTVLMAVFGSELIAAAVVARVLGNRGS